MQAIVLSLVLLVRLLLILLGGLALGYLVLIKGTLLEGVPIGCFCRYFKCPRIDKDKYDNDQILEEVDRAMKEWLNAQNYFANVTDPELVDHSILVCQAAEKKYQYLLRVAKNHEAANKVLPIETYKRN